MRTIHKYVIDPKDISPTVYISMPENSKVLACQIQYADKYNICIWAEVETENKMFPKCFGIFGTSNPLTTSVPMNYISTFQLQGYVWHIYEYV